jgi:hypothetical protein
VALDNDLFFFVGSGAVDLEPRQACPVEAAARLHPGKKVFLVFITANVTDILTSSTLSYLLSFENINMRYIRVSK